MIPKRPTIDDVAQLAGVSIKTVSRVFNQEPNVRPETRNKVVAAAETLDYRPNLSARQLASNRTFLVGMLYQRPDPENENDYVTAVQSGCFQACQENGYRLLINPCQANPDDLLREVVGLHRQVDGFVVLQPPVGRGKPQPVSAGQERLVCSRIPTTLRWIPMGLGG